MPVAARWMPGSISRVTGFLTSRLVSVFRLFDTLIQSSPQVVGTGEIKFQEESYEAYRHSDVVFLALFCVQRMAASRSTSPGRSAITRSNPSKIPIYNLRRPGRRYRRRSGHLPRQNRNPGLDRGKCCRWEWRNAGLLGGA